MKFIKKIHFIILILFILTFGVTSSLSIEDSITLDDALDVKSNWNLGYLESYGGSLKEDVSNVYYFNTEIYLKPGTYYIHLNDSTIKLGVHTYGENNKWLKYYGDLTNNSKIVIDDNVSYIKLNLSCSTWNKNPTDLFDYGLDINISDNVSIYNNMFSIMDISTIDFKDMSNYKSGYINSSTGLYTLNSKSLIFNYYISLDDTKYVINLPNSSFKTEIIEYDENGNKIKSGGYSSGRTFKKSTDTAYIAINIINGSSSTYTSSELYDLINNYSKTLFTKYEKYNYNTDMDISFTAYDFASDMTIGWNLGNSLEASYHTSVGIDVNVNQETSWGNPYVTEDLIKYVKSLGFNTIRIPVTWYTNSEIDENGNVTIGTEWLSRVQDVVNYAIKNDMYVIINTMKDENNVFYVGVEDTTEWNIVKNSYSTMWNSIATYFKDYDEHLIFESMNEIGSKSGWTYSKLATSQINELNQLFVNTVRNTGSNNKYRLLMLPTYTTSTAANVLNDFVLPTDTVENKLIITVHDYNSNYYEFVEEDFIELEKFSIKNDAPVVIGEFGMCNTSTLQSARVVHATNFLSYATKHGIKCIVWDDNGNFQLVNRLNFAKSKLDIINGMFDGYTNGTAYVANSIETYDSVDNFVDAILNYSNGNISYPDYKTSWWNSLTLTTDTKTIKNTIDKSKKYLELNLKHTGNASRVWVVGIVWYDKNGDYLGLKAYKQLNHKYSVIEIPSNAYYYSVSIHDPYTNKYIDKYDDMFNSGELSLSVRFTDDDLDLTKIKLSLTKYDYSNRKLNTSTTNKYQTYLDTIDLSNIYTYVSGEYKNGTFSVLTSMISTKTYYKVVSGTNYKVELSNENLKLRITCLDENYNYIDYKTFSNGDEYIVDDNTKYVALTLYDSTWNINTIYKYEDEISNGLIIKLNNTNNVLEFNIDNFDIKDEYVIGNVNNYKVSDIKEFISTNQSYSIIRDNADLSDDELIHTGDIIKFNNVSYTIILKGDINKDGYKDDLDTDLLANYIINENIDELTIISTDINEDGIIDINDLVISNNNTNINDINIIYNKNYKLDDNINLTIDLNNILDSNGSFAILMNIDFDNLILDNIISNNVKYIILNNKLLIYSNNYMKTNDNKLKLTFKSTSVGTYNISLDNIKVSNGYKEEYLSNFNYSINVLEVQEEVDELEETTELITTVDDNISIETNSNETTNNTTNKVTTTTTNKSKVEETTTTTELTEEEKEEIKVTIDKKTNKHIIIIVGLCIILICISIYIKIKNLRK